MERAIIIAIVLAVIGAFAYLVSFIINEAERKLQRSLTIPEIMVGAMAGPWAVLFVLMLLPEPPPKK